jgi:5'-nucleotidase (lipoprotein e(P4) family)
MYRLLVLAALLPVLSGCIMAVSAPHAPHTVEPAHAPHMAEEPAELPFEIHWVRNSAEYVAALEQTYRFATEVLEGRIDSREPGTWAVAIDADETLISNSQQSKERALTPEDVPFEEVWDEWVDRRAAPPLPGARRFLETVRERGGHIAVVTNRRERHCTQTAENLEALEMPFDVILCRGETRDKHPRWESVEKGTASPDLPPLEIVMWVGDNIHDFPGLDQELRFASPAAFSDFGDMFIILPNPLYGSWEENPPD